MRSYLKKVASLEAQIRAWMPHRSISFPPVVQQTKPILKEVPCLPRLEWLVPAVQLFSNLKLRWEVRIICIVRSGISNFL